MEGMIDREALHRYVGFILDLHEQRKDLNADIAARYEEAKAAGFVTKIVRQIVREKQMEDDEREAHYNLLDSYRHALGMLADTPLGEAAVVAATIERPRPFAEQPVGAGMRGSAAPVHRPSRRSRKPDLVDDMIDTANRARPRGRPRKADRDDDALKRALEGEPAGAA